MVPDWGGTLVLAPVAYGAVAYAVLGERTLRGLGLRAYVRIAPRFARLVGAAIVSGFLTLLGFLLLIIPGCLLIARWSVYVPAIVAESGSGLGLDRSRDLTAGRRWVGFWVAIIPSLPVVVVEVVLQLWTGIEGEAAWRFGATAATGAYGAVAAAVLYRRLVEQD